ncbi:MAG: putative Ig domain-containing protein [Colwellia sp.]|nr:putative Ig domain-containing protein [Colwellia sp.]MCW8866063.1 putative Ig domain-containing protein [Colwellia sp.]MCW9081237.1 putative Ig domain-containing protein [Colwellia sp.]
MNKSNTKLVKTLLTVGLSLALSACGSSSSDTPTPAPTPTPTPTPNTAPVISSTAVNTVEAGSEYSYTLASSDADGDTLTLSASSLPSWLSFDSATGVLSGTPAEADEGDHAITLTVSDGTDEVTQSFSIGVTVPVAANNAPTITSDVIISATVGEAYSYTLTATDADNDTLTMSTTIPGALSWLTFDAATGILSGTPASGDVAATEITLTVNDGTDDTMQTFTITVTDVMVEPTPALVVYEDAANPLWGAWDCCGGTTPAIITDSDPAYDQVTQFTINGDTVVGFNARDAVGGVAFDTPAGTTLEFDLKVTAMPTGGDTDWMLKLEGGGVAEVNLNTSVEGQAPVLDTWVHYTFNVADLGLTNVNLIMMFPAWGTGDGAEYSIDNVVFYTDDNTPPPPPSGFTPVGTPYDFEAAGLGSDFDWAVFENDDNPALEFVANPASSAVNDSAIVAKFTARQTGQPWAGTETTAANTPAFTMDATNSIVKIMVYKSVISDVALKFSVGAAAQPEIKVANTKINEWEELTFDFSSRIGMAETIGINSVIVFPDFNLDGRASDTVSYFDNITFGHNE